MKKIKITKENIAGIIFILFFCLCMVLPVCFMNFKANQISEMENKKLTDWPQMNLSEETLTQIQDYFEDRIGFRESAIWAYTELNNSIFHVMVHPLYMWGEEGHIFYKDKDYIAAYQRLNTDDEYLDSMVDFLEKTNDYLASKDIDFLYFVCPDKKTIYSEYFPKTVYVDYEKTPVLDYIDAKMAETNVAYIDPRNNLLAAKSQNVVYNKLYDATHWNDLGGMVAEDLIDQHIQSVFDDVPPMSDFTYDLSYVTMESLDNAKFTINEDVPLYTLRDDYTADYTELLKLDMQCTTDSFYSHHINTTAPNERRLLIFTDSYLQAHQKYYDNRFKEVYLVHRQNYDYLQYFVNLVFPDMVIFETAERSISSEMPITTDFTDYYYEPAYKGDKEYVRDDSISYEITYTDGGRIDGSYIYLDPNDTTAIFRADGVVTADNGRKLDLYVSTQDETMEADFAKLHRESVEEGIDKFSFSIQRRYMAQSYIDFFAYDEETDETILLETFEVKYDE